MTETDYIIQLAKYSDTIKTSVRISRLIENKTVEERRVWASVLFTKICVTGVSIFILCPNSDIADKKVPHWDYSSIFSLSRNLIECYQTFYYLCIEKISDDEYKARKALFNLHDFNSRKEISFLASSEIFDNEIEENLKNELKSTIFFQTLDSKQQKHFLGGHNAFFINRVELEERMGNDKDTFKLLYKLFSSNTHSLPLGFYKMVEGKRGRGVKSEVEVGYHKLALEVIEQYLRGASKDMLELFPEVRELLTDFEFNHINN